MSQRPKSELSTKYGVLWFPEEPLLTDAELQSNLFEALGRENQGRVELPLRTDTEYRPTWGIFKAGKISSKYTFWEHPPGHRIDRVREILFPFKVIGAAGIVIEPIDLQSQLRSQEEKEMILRGQIHHLTEIVKCTKGLDLPLMFLCLRRNEVAISLGVLLGQSITLSPVEVFNYHVDRLESLKGDLLGFLETAECNSS